MTYNYSYQNFVIKLIQNIYVIKNEKNISF
jgi:hypothetical protein